MFPTLPPWVLRLSPGLLHCANPWYLLLSADPRLTQNKASRFATRFQLKNDEKRFVRHLFDKKANFWVFRCDQQRFCGDFVLVDMSSNQKEKRPCTVLDLKRGAPLKQGGGGAGIQFKNARKAVYSVSKQFDIIPPDAPYEILCGDKDELFHYWRKESQ